MIGQLFNQFVIAFREGIEASLIIMTVLIALKKRGDVRLERAAKGGIWAAIAACVIGGWALGAATLVSNAGHGIEAVLYGAAAITVISMVFWMMYAGKRMKGNIEEKFGTYKSSESNTAALVGIFVFVFFMIAREGFEMVLLLLAFSKGINGYWFVVSALLGIGMAVLFSYALSRGMVKINLGKFLQQSAYVLLIFAIQLVFDVIHELGEGGFIPDFSNQSISNFIDYVHDQVPIFSYIGLGLFLILVAYHFGRATFSSKHLPTPRKPVRA